MYMKKKKKKANCLWLLVLLLGKCIWSDQIRSAGKELFQLPRSVTTF